MKDNQNTTTAYQLQCLTMLRFRGADAATFLQGQLTVNVSALAAGHFRRTAYCSRQGRMLANGLLGRLPDSDSEFVFVVYADIAEVVADALRKFVLRAKLKIEIANAAAFIVPATAAAGTVMQTETAITLSDEKWALSFYESAAGELPDGDAVWMAGEISRGIVWVNAATQDKFIPQFANYDVLEGIDFDKGCYVGQEIIARLHYRGEVKRRAICVCGEGEPPPPATPLQDSAGKGVGEIANSVVNSDSNGGYSALAVVQLSSYSAVLQVNGMPVRVFLPPLVAALIENS